MDKRQLLYGFFLGLAVCMVGIALFLLGAMLVVDGETPQTLYKKLMANGRAGQMIALGAFLNFVTFFILLKMKRELMARGIILSVIVLTIITLLV